MLGVDILVLAIENELIALRTEINSGLLPKQDKSKDIAILFTVSLTFPQAQTSLTNLFPALKEERIWVNAIRDRAANNRKPVEDDWRLVRVLEEELFQDVQNNDQDEEGGETAGDNDTSSILRNLGF